MRSCLKLFTTLLLVLSASHYLSAANGDLELLSGVDPGFSASVTASGSSGVPILSENGNYVLFASTAKNLAGAGTNATIPFRSAGVPNVFFKNRSAGTTTLVSENQMGSEGGNEGSIPLGLSANNRYVLFVSWADNLLPGDTNGASDIFMRDLETKTTRLVSVSTNGRPANGNSHSAVMTPDGRYVAFVSSASDVTEGDTNRFQDVFLRDMETGETTLVSVGAVSHPWSFPRSSHPSISADGRWVAFCSTATNLVVDVPVPRTMASIEGLGHWYVRDVVTGTTVWADRDAARLLKSYQPVSAVNGIISEDGQYVVFQASDALAGKSAVFKHDITTAQTKLISTNAASLADSLDMLSMTPSADTVAFITGAATGTTHVVVWKEPGVTKFIPAATPPLSTTTAPALDRSGRYVAFLSNLSGLGTNQAAEGWHVYVRDMVQNVTLRANSGDAPVDASSAPVIAQGGGHVAFEAGSARWSPQDHNNAADVLVYDLGRNLLEVVPFGRPGTSSATPNGPASMSSQPISATELTAFHTFASDLIPKDTNGFYDVFVHAVGMESNILVSANTNGLPANGNSTDPLITPDRRYVVFASSATDLVFEATTRSINVYRKDLALDSITLLTKNMPTPVHPDGDAVPLAMSDDGRFVLISAVGTNPAVPTSGTGPWPVLLDTLSGRIDVLGSNNVADARMTADGRFVAFTSGARTLAVPHLLHVWDSTVQSLIYMSNVGVLQGPIAISPNGKTLVYGVKLAGFKYELRALDLLTKSNWLIAPHQLARSHGLSFSADGMRLAYSAAVGPDTNRINQVYLHDFRTGTNLLVSRSFATGTNGNGNSEAPDISPDGRLIAYRSKATDLAAEDLKDGVGTFVYDHQTGLTIRLGASNSTGASFASPTQRFSPDGKYLLIKGEAGDLLAGLADYNHLPELVLFHVDSASLTPVFRLAMSPDQAGVLLTWPAEPGKNYGVEYTESLTSPSWQRVTEGVTLQNNQGWLRQPSNAGNRFFRVVAEP